MDDNLLFVREAQSVFADKGHSKGLTVHGFLATWPVHKLIFCLKERNNTTTAFQTPCVCLKNPVDHKTGLINRDDQQLTSKTHLCLKQIYYYSCQILCPNRRCLLFNWFHREMVILAHSY